MDKEFGMVKEEVRTILSEKHSEEKKLNMFTLKWMDNSVG